MDVSYVHSKIAEADFFLRLLKQQEPRIIGEKKPFDYFLSAFLNAAMSARNGFQVRQDRARNAAVKEWRERWRKSLGPDEAQLYEFMREDRVAEHHHGGSSRDVAQERVEFPIGTHYVDGGMIMIGGPPGMEPAVAERPVYTFTINRTERRVTEACSAYLALLQRMVAQFEVDHP